MNRAIDVERTFAAFVRSYGGEVVEDLVGASPDFPNADLLSEIERSIFTETGQTVDTGLQL